MDCTKIITIKQDWSNCWFVSILMVIFYSQESRKILLDKYINWISEDDLKKKEILDIFRDILISKYIKTKKNDYYYVKDKYILELLHNYNSNIFNFNPSKQKGGYNSYKYLYKLYNFLGIDNLLLIMNDNNEIFFDYYKYDDISNQSVLDELKKLYPSIIIIETIDIKNTHTSFEKYCYIDNIILLKNKIIYNNTTYILDSIILNNFNIGYINHAISGITCNNERYIYNGWGLFRPRTSFIKLLPCDLIKFDWDITNNDTFSINKLNCGITKKHSKIDLSFSFSKGKRLLIYTKENNSQDDKTSSIIDNPSPIIHNSLSQVVKTPSLSFKTSSQVFKIGTDGGNILKLKNYKKNLNNMTIEKLQQIANNKKIKITKKYKGRIILLKKDTIVNKIINYKYNK